MQWNLVFTVVAIVAGVLFIKKDKNNVCKTFSDYYSNRDSNPNCYYNGDHLLQVPDIARRHGYSVETHVVTTDDGYILNVFRIYRNQLGIEHPGKPILLLHGLTLDSGIFVLRGSKSLAFMLADAGYDVWLGNFRGTKYSMNHVNLKNTELKYWNFSFHELGVYDLPAQLKLVNTLTNQKAIYIGYSIGAIAGTIYGSTYPKKSHEEISLFVALTPAVTFHNVRILQILSYLPSMFESTINYLSNGVIYPRPPLPKALFKFLCFPYPIQMEICQLPDMIALGYHYEENDPESLPVTLQHNMEASSVKTLYHALQVVRSGRFLHYDYGEEGNKRIYGDINAPPYDLSKIMFSSLLFYSENDAIITPENVKILYNMLPNKTNAKELYQITNLNYNHIDFVSAKNADIYVYKPLIAQLRKREAQ
ncbi:hypothetical protein FQA39_LY14478 [Lamprigera yunnana]|nr:hypothetical protein FQA39_LY14478 [Lamprigera yunnana]